MFWVARVFQLASSSGFRTVGTQDGRPSAQSGLFCENLLFGVGRSRSRSVIRNRVGARRRTRFPRDFHASPLSPVNPGSSPAIRKTRCELIFASRFATLGKNSAQNACSRASARGFAFRGESRALVFEDVSYFGANTTLLHSNATATKDQGASAIPQRVSCMREEVTLGESRFRFLKVQYTRSEMKGNTLFSRTIQKKSNRRYYCLSFFLWRAFFFFVFAF